VPGEPWAPGVDEVARHIPRRTRDSRSPGSDTVLGTFTSSTTPTASQAQAFIDAAVRSLVALVGVLPATGDPAAVANLQGAARDAAEWRAAADIELAYPNREADVTLAAALDARAVTALAALRTALAEAGAGTVDVSPEWMFPDPVLTAPWGDRTIL